MSNTLFFLSFLIPSLLNGQPLNKTYVLPDLNELPPEREYDYRNESFNTNFHIHVPHPSETSFSDEDATKNVNLQNKVYNAFKSDNMPRWKSLLLKQEKIFDKNHWTEFCLVTWGEKEKEDTVLSCEFSKHINLSEQKPYYTISVYKSSSENRIPINHILICYCWRQNSIQVKTLQHDVFFVFPLSESEYFKFIRITPPRGRILKVVDIVSNVSTKFILK